MLRDRLTITLEPDLVQAIDQLVDGDTLRNRSHAIEHLLREGLGLYQLSQAFLFFEEEWEQSHLDQVIRLVLREQIKQIYLVLPSGSPTLVQDIQSLVYRHELPSNAIQIVPAEFGSGGALALQKENLAFPFLLIWVDAQLVTPQSLAQAFTFHRQHHSLLTQLLHSSGSQHFRFSGIAIAEPEIIQSIPSGIASLRESVFPELLKAGKVRGYPISTT